MSRTFISAAEIDEHVCEPLVFQLRGLQPLDQVDWSKERWVSMDNVRSMVKDLLNPTDATVHEMAFASVTNFIVAMKKKKMGFIEDWPLDGQMRITQHSDVDVNLIRFDRIPPNIRLPFWWYEWIIWLAGQQIYMIFKEPDGWTALNTSGEEIRMNEYGTILAGPSQGVVRVQASAKSAPPQTVVEEVHQYHLVVPKRLDVVPMYVARDYEVYPLSLSGKKLCLAIDSLDDTKALDDLRRLLSGYELTFKITPRHEIRAVLGKNYLHRQNTVTGSLRNRKNESLVDVPPK